MNKIKLTLVSVGAVIGGFLTTLGVQAAGTLTASDTLPIVQGGIDTLKETLLTFLPVILPVAIVLAIFFGAYYWIKHAGHGR